MNGSAFVSPLSAIFYGLSDGIDKSRPYRASGRVQYVVSVGNNAGEGLETKKREVG